MNLPSRQLMVLSFAAPILRLPPAWASPATRRFRGADWRTWFRPSLALAGLLTLGAPGMAQPPPTEKAVPAAPTQPPPEAQPTPTPSPEARTEEERPPLRDLGQVSPAEPAPEPVRRTRRRSGGDDDIPLGSHSVPAGSGVRDAVSLLGSTTVNGSVDSDAVSIFGATMIAAGGRVGGAAVAVFGRLESQGEIGDEAVSVLGGMVINGPVGGDAVSVLGNMHLGPKALIEGDVVVVGGRLIKDPNAIVHGNEVHLSAFGGVPSLDWFTTWLTRCAFYGRPLAFGKNLGWAWLIAFSFLGFYLLLGLLFPRGVVRCVETLETRPGYSILASVLTVFLSPVAIVLLAVTIVGALLIPFLGAGLLFAKLFGKAVMLAWIGRRFTRFFGPGPLGHPFFAVLIGGLIVLLIYTIPVVGFLSYKLLSWLGLGVVVYTIALSVKREKRPVIAGPLPPPGPEVAAVPYAPVAPSVAFSGSEPTAIPPQPQPPMMSSGFTAASVGAMDVPRVPEVGPPPVPPMMSEAAGPVTPPPVTPPPAASGFMPPPASIVPPRAMQPPPVGAAVVWPRAGFFVRLGALAIDGVLIGLIMAFIVGLLPRSFEFHHGPGGWLVVLAIYGALMWKHKGTTIGGIVCGLKVVRVDNRPIDWSTAIVRALACFLSLAVAGLGFIWVAIDDEKQSWHDKIAGTAVVLVPRGVSLV